MLIVRISFCLLLSFNVLRALPCGTIALLSFLVGSCSQSYLQYATVRINVCLNCLLVKFVAFINMFWRAIGHCTVHDLLQCMFFTELGTLVTSGGELYSDDELGDWEIGCAMMHGYLH